MRQAMKYIVSSLFAIALLSSTPAVYADWKETLGNLWSTTKSGAEQLTETVKEKVDERFNPKEPVEIGIAYGTEKKAWLEWAVAEFAKTEKGQQIKINLIPKGSVEGAEAILKQDDEAKKIHVWSPASSIVQALLSDPWEAEHGNDPVVSDSPLALTPMVIVMWEDRYEAFVNKYTDINFNTIANALNEEAGWQAIAEKPEWGMFTFGHTLPTYSNSGLMALVLMAYDYYDTMRALDAAKIMNQEFQTWLAGAQKYMTVDEESTGQLMKSMMRFGPSKFNGIMVYENLALSNLDKAAGRWGKLKVVYPKRTVWNDNPYLILDVPWSDQEKQDAAKLFQNFLLSDAAQKQARDEYLFRPASLDLPIMGEGSKFDELKDIVKLDVSAISRPNAQVLQQLIQVWERSKK